MANKKMVGKENGGANRKGARITSIPAAINNRIGSVGSGTPATHVEEGRVKVADVSGSVTFSATRIAINPGLLGTFGTRLANIASGYEKYTFLKDLRVEYVPSQAVTTTAGTVWLGFDYDPSDGAPETDVDFSTYETWVSTNVFNKVSLDMLKRRSFDNVQHKKVRAGPVGGDLLLYDPGSLIIATDDCVNTNDLGKIYLHYSFVFYSPQSTVGRTPTALLSASLTGDQTLASGVAENVEFDDILVNGMGIEIAGAAFVLQPGSYYVTGTIVMANSATSSTTGEVATAIDTIIRRNHTLTWDAKRMTITYVDYIVVPVGSTSNLTIVAECTAASGTLTLIGGSSFLTITAL